MVQDMYLHQICRIPISFEFYTLGKMLGNWNIIRGER